MSNSEIPSDKREFRCIHCDGKIQIPKDLPPTTGPCPHCRGVITSPTPEIGNPVSPLTPPVAVAPTPPAAQVSPPVSPLPEISALRQPAAEPVPSSETPAPISSSALKKPEKLATTTSSPRRKSGLIPVMLVLLVLIIAGGVAVFFVSNEMGRNIPPPTINLQPGDAALPDNHYLRIGWQKEAYQVLRDFMAAQSSEEKIPFILNGEALAEKINDFYGGAVINDSDSPSDSFSPYELSMEDRKRGLFLMIYDRPMQFDIKEFFRPLAAAEVQAGIDDAGILLSSLARADNFTMEPLRVHAYFKRTPSGLKLDWEVFVQTKYRTLQSFVELPEVGQIGVFRVFVAEDVPDKIRQEPGCRTYSVFDTANPSDSARINVKVDSEVGRALSIINWRETKDRQPSTRTATVELKWSGEEASPQLAISRFICWEFLGLGGQDTPTASPAATTPAAASAATPEQAPSK